MSYRVEWIAAQADSEERQNHFPVAENAGRTAGLEDQNPHFWQTRPDVGHPETESQNPLDQEICADLERQNFLSDARAMLELLGERLSEEDPIERERRIYRGRTVGMLRRYMRYSIETGRLPSILGREFFRAKVTSYTVVTFEDRVIFVHDMEKCLEKLDEFSRQLIARHILQEHDRWETARLLQCNEKTVRRLMPLALDVLSEILLDVGLLDRLSTDTRKSCQGGFQSQKFVSGCEQGKNKF